MCTELCPCDPGEANAIKKQWEAYGDSFYEKYGRNFKQFNRYNNKGGFQWASSSQ